MKPFSSVIASVILSTVLAQGETTAATEVAPSGKKDDGHITCPILNCSEQLGLTKDEGEAGASKLCYVHDALGATQQIKASLCYDKRTATVADAPTYCEFDPKSGEFMWIEERLQFQINSSII